MLKKLPESELNIMIVLWSVGEPVTRAEIEKQLEKKVAPTTVSTILTRLADKDFIDIQKRGNTNFYSAIIKKEEYLYNEGTRVLRKLFKGSLKSFVATLFDKEEISTADLDELQEFIEQERRKNDI